MGRVQSFSLQAVRVFAACVTGWPVEEGKLLAVLVLTLSAALSDFFWRAMLSMVWRSY
jgi:hypothetical protein